MWKASGGGQPTATSRARKNAQVGKRIRPGDSGHAKLARPWMMLSATWLIRWSNLSLL